MTQEELEVELEKDQKEYEWMQAVWWMDEMGLSKFMIAIDGLLEQGFTRKQLRKWLDTFIMLHEKVDERLKEMGIEENPFE